MNVKQALLNQVLENVAEAADQELNGREYGRELDKLIDAKIGEGTSEKLQRGPVSNFMLEIVEGLWSEDPTALAIELEKRAKELRAGVPPTS